MSKESGFTLLEVIIAILLMAFVFLALARLPNFYKQIREDYETKLLADVYLENKIEVIRGSINDATSYNNLTSIPKDAGSDVYDRTFYYTVTVNNKQINTDGSLSDTSLVPPQVKEVVVQIDSDYHGVTRTYEDKFIISSP